jgi:hypothetical protein
MTMAKATNNTTSVTKIFFMVYFSFAPYDANLPGWIRAEPAAGKFLPNLYTAGVEGTGSRSKLHTRCGLASINRPYLHPLICVLTHEDRNAPGTRPAEACTAV